MGGSPTQIIWIYTVNSANTTVNWWFGFLGSPFVWDCFWIPNHRAPNHQFITARHQREAGWGETLTFCPPKKVALSKSCLSTQTWWTCQNPRQKMTSTNLWLLQGLSLNLFFLGVGEVQRVGGWTGRASKNRQVSYHIGDLADGSGTRSLGISTTTTDRCDAWVLGQGFGGLEIWTVFKYIVP